MSVTLLALAAAAAAGMGYLAARRRYRSEALGEAADAPGSKDVAGAPSAASRSADPSGLTPEAPLTQLPFTLGDVVCAGGEERWLAGALVAREDGRLIGALFLAPEGGAQHAVVAFAPPARHVFWLAPAQAECPAEPPATVEIGGVSYARRGRIPARIQRLGQGAPDVGETALWATYEAGGRDVAVIVAGSGKVHCWAGVRLEEGDYDRLGKGGDD